MLRAYLLDDEPLAVRQLARMVQATGKLQIVGTSSDPISAIAEIETLRPDVLFLDIEMGTATGFSVLEQLQVNPQVVFTTAYAQYALQAFQVNSIDYLLKPIGPEELDRALQKLEQRNGTALGQALQLLQQTLRPPTISYPARLPSRIGEKVEFVDLHHVSHFYAADKLTFAVTSQKEYVIDQSIAQLETRLDPEAWFRIHRSTLLQLAFVQELHDFVGGRLLVRLKDDRKSELQVARERAAELKKRLGI